MWIFFEVRIGDVGDFAGESMNLNQVGFVDLPHQRSGTAFIDPQ